MMKSEMLNYEVLKVLKGEGYNVLIASQGLIDEINPIWKAVRVGDLWDFVLQLDCRDWALPFTNPSILVIEDALDNFEEKDLKGCVILDN